MEWLLKNQTTEIWKNLERVISKKLFAQTIAKNRKTNQKKWWQKVKKQSKTGQEQKTVELLFCVICSDKKAFTGRDTGYYALILPKFEIF